MIVLILAIGSGTLTGLLTGLVPGLHVNAAAAIVAGTAAALATAPESALAAAAFVTAAALAHTFAECLPAFFLGIPDDAYLLMPGHRLVRAGLGREVIRLCATGAWQGALYTLPVAALLLAFSDAETGPARIADAWLRPSLGWILAGISLALIRLDRRPGWASAVFLCSGLLGLVILDSPLVPAGDGTAFTCLLPALSGLFGISGLIVSLLPGTTTASMAVEPPGETEARRESGFLGAVAGMAAGFLPGLGAANLAVLATIRQQEHDDASYIALTSAINSANALFAIASLYLLDKIRSGPAAAVAILLPALEAHTVVVLGAAALASAWLSRLLLSAFGPALAVRIGTWPQQALALGVMAFLTTLVLVTTGVWGVIILAASTCLGLVAPLAGTNRAHAMGLFVVPVTLYFAGLEGRVRHLLIIPRAAAPADDQSLSGILLALALSIVAGTAAYLFGRHVGWPTWQAKLQTFMTTASADAPATQPDVPTEEADDEWLDLEEWD